jgi:hypothetical protein
MSQIWYDLLENEETVSLQSEETDSLRPFPPIPQSEIPSNPPAAVPYDDTSWLPHQIKQLLNKGEKLHSLLFKFEVTPEAAKFNVNLLKEHEFDLNTLLNPPNKIITKNYGSKFKALGDLENLLKYHPRWKDLAERLSSGCKYLMSDISEEDRRRDVEGNIERGSHKLASRMKITSFLPWRKKFRMAGHFLLTKKTQKTSQELKFPPWELQNISALRKQENMCQSDE